MIKMIVENEELKPTVGTAGSAGYDLKISHDIILTSGNVMKVGTGVKVQIPEGYVGLIIPRSSCTGIELQNVIGVIDSDYQGELFLKLKNNTRTTYLGYKGDQLMQLVIVANLNESISYVKDFEVKTERGEKGFGSTTKKK